MRISDWSSDVCSSDLGSECSSLLCVPDGWNSRPHLPMQTDHPASNDPRKPVLAVRLPGGGLSTRTGIVMSRFLLSTSTLAAALLTSNTAFAQSDGQNQAPTPRATDIIVIGMLNTDQATAEIERTPGAVEV